MVTLQAPDLVTSSPAVTVIMQLHKDGVNRMAQARRESLQSSLQVPQVKLSDEL